MIHLFGEILVAQEEARLYSRENSTLVFATVAASASLLILTFALQKSDRLPIWDWIGFIFSLLGPAYREVTILTIDFFDYKKIPEKDKYPFRTTLPRMLIIRFFLYLPIAAWILLFARPESSPESSWLIMLLIALFGVALSAGVLSGVELLQRKRLRHERIPTEHEIKEAQPPQKGEIEDRCERVDRLFDIVLVLITTFSAITLAHVTFAQNTAEVNFAFRVLMTPLIILIGLWLIRGLVSSLGRIPSPWKMLLRQFCWAFFGQLFILNALIFAYSVWIIRSFYQLFLIQNQIPFIFSVPIDFWAMWNYAECYPGHPFFRRRSLGFFIWTIVGPGIGQILSWLILSRFILLASF